MAVRVELFSSPSCAAGGSGQGQTLAGAANATTDGSGNATFSANVTPLAPGQILTATATNTTADPSSQPGSVKVFNTSPFSTCFTVPVRPTSAAVSCAPSFVFVAVPTACTATVSDAAPGSASTPGGLVTFASDGPGSFSNSGSCTLSAGSCQVTYTPAAVGSGAHRITASYGGDAAHAPSGGSTIETVWAIGKPPPCEAAPHCPAVLPVITNVRETTRVWRAGNGFAGLSRNPRPVGTTFTFDINEQARVSFTFTTRILRRRGSGKCAVQTARHRHSRVCVLTVTAGTLGFTAHRGANTVTFQGRLSATKKLRPGRHTVTISAVDAAGQRSAPHTLAFTIVA
jgi:hypothetical protein